MHPLFDPTLLSTTALDLVTRPVAYSLIRFSSRKQADGDSFRRQLEPAAAFCTAKGLVLDTSLHMSDVRRHGVSAWKGKQISRGPLGRFLHLVETGEIPAGSWLLVEDIDRLTRQVHTEAYGLCLRLLKAGIVIATLMDGETYTFDEINSDVGKRLKLQFKLDAAHEHSQKLSNRLRPLNANKRKRAAAGEITFGGNRGPVWLRPRGDKHPQFENRQGYDEVEPHLSTLRYFFGLADDGNGANAIARILNSDLDKYPSFDRRKDKSGRSEWNEKTIGRLLRDRSVIGEWQGYRLVEQLDRDGKPTGKTIREKDGDPAPDHYPCVIDKAQFRRVQDGLDRRRTGGGRRGENFRNLFVGRCYCATCGGKLRITEGRKTSDGGERHYFRCSRSRNSDCTRKTGFEYAIFEKAFLGAVGIGIERMVAALAPEGEPDYRLLIRQLEDRIATKETNIAGMFKRYAQHSSDAARAASEATIDELGREIDGMKVELDRYRDRQQVATSDSDYQLAFVRRLQAGIKVLETATGNDLYVARAKLADMLTQRVDRVVLHQTEQVMTAHINDGRGGQLAPLQLDIDRDGICAFRLLAADGTDLLSFDRAGWDRWLEMTEPAEVDWDDVSETLEPVEAALDMTESEFDRDGWSEMLEPIEVEAA